MQFNPRVAELAPKTKLAFDAARITDHLMLAMAGEAARCLAERVVASERELDLAMVFGTGFPPFRGGLMRYVRARGVGETAAALERLAGDEVVRSRDGARGRFDSAPVRALPAR
jgi:3-hydroxyacyl-CoA dehydrogenase/enoyl-CoA hydratase/3-hydroxybutyryl-CoA epimerase